MNGSTMHSLVRGRLRPGVLSLLVACLVAFGPSGATAQEASPVAIPHYEVTDLGTLGGAYSEAYYLNSKGHVVGMSEVASGPGATPAAATGQSPVPTHAFLWRDGEMIDLGTLGGPTSRTTGINDADHIAGGADTAAGVPHAFLWKDGTMTDLGTLGGDASDAIGINNSDQIVGLSTTGPGQELGDAGTHAFLWDNGTMTDLGTLGGEFSRANGINDAGQIVGGAETEDGSIHPVIWENGTMTDLGVISGFKSGRAVRINRNGDIVGFMYDPVAQPGTGVRMAHGFVYLHGKYSDVGTFGGPGSFATDVNTAGQAVGHADIGEAIGDAPPPSHGYLWHDGVKTDLNDLLAPGSEWEIVQAFQINAAGQIAGVGKENGTRHALRLDPVDS